MQPSYANHPTAVVELAQATPDKKTRPRAIPADYARVRLRNRLQRPYARVLSLKIPIETIDARVPKAGAMYDTISCDVYSSVVIDIAVTAQNLPLELLGILVP